MNVGEIIDELYEIRSMRLDFENQAEALKFQEKQLEFELINLAKDLGVQSLKGGYASFSIKDEVTPTVIAWAPIYEFIKLKDDFTLLQKRLSVASWREYYETENLIIPGTQEFNITKASLRKI